MENIINLVFQLAVIIFAVRIFGKLAAKVGIPSVLGELVAGILIGPFALGKIPLPCFEGGFFAGGVSPELEAFSQIASIILLFASGLETDLSGFEGKLGKIYDVKEYSLSYSTGEEYSCVFLAGHTYKLVANKYIGRIKIINTEITTTKLIIFNDIFNLK